MNNSKLEILTHNSECRTLNGDFEIDENRLKSFSNEQFIELWKERQFYISQLESDLKKTRDEKQEVINREQQLKTLLSEAQQRERILIRKLTIKEQEMQDFICQLQELKGNQGQESSTSLQSTLLDPSVNLIIEILQDELKKAKIKVEDTQSELTAWKFTPDSNTGKRLMAKCRLLYQENEELGKLTNSGRIAKLEGELALQKSFSDEVKKSQQELDEFLQDLDDDVEGMQSTIYLLQQELRTAKEAQQSVQNDYNQLKNSFFNNSTTSCTSLVVEEISEPGHERTSKSLSSSNFKHNKNNSDIHTHTTTNNSSCCSNKNSTNSGADGGVIGGSVKRTRNSHSVSEQDSDFSSPCKYFKDDNHHFNSHKQQQQQQSTFRSNNNNINQEDTILLNNNDIEDDDDALIISTNGCDVALSED